MVKTEKWAPGIYRVRAFQSPVFGQVRKNDGWWVAEIRNTKTGDVVRPAGIWATLRDAADECAHLIPKTCVLTTP